MTAGLLLDTHAAVWWRNRALLRSVAKDRITEAERSDALYLSPMSVWELVFALQKVNPARKPDLGGLTPEMWFSHTMRDTGALITNISAEIAGEAASIAGPYGSGDMGDCFLLATAHVSNLTLVTRDHRILRFAQSNPNYLSTLRC